jgi:rRNA maturation protein Nop10
LGGVDRENERMSGHEKRLRSLEASYGMGGSDECPECGQRDHRPGDTYEIVFADDDEDLREISDESEYCPACGEPTNYYIFFEDIDYKDDV